MSYSFDRGYFDFIDGLLPAKEFLSRKTYSVISILLTYKCPAKCAHCVFYCSPTRKETISSAVAKRFISAAANQPLPPKLSLSGGDPFLEKDLLIDLIRFADDRGMISEVISSSGWITSYDAGKSLFNKLRGLGLATYCTSIDDFHSKFISDEQFSTVLTAAHDAGLKIAINTQRSGRTKLLEEDEFREEIRERLDLPDDLVSSCRVNILRTTPAGRGKDGAIDFAFTEKNLNEGCPMATEIITLSPTADIYPCCGMVVGGESGPNNPFNYCNITTCSTEKTSEYIQKLKQDLLFKVIQTLGPYRLLRILNNHDETIEVRNNYTGPCEVCLDIVSNPKKLTLAAKRTDADC